MIRPPGKTTPGVIASRVIRASVAEPEATDKELARLIGVGVRYVRLVLRAYASGFWKRVEKV